MTMIVNGLVLMGATGQNRSSCRDDHRRRGGGQPAPASGWIAWPGRLSPPPNRCASQDLWPPACARGHRSEVWPGEVVGLVGDNGAGKSTLVRCIAGYDTPDAGEITVDGVFSGSGGPKRAAELGIEIVHQDLSLVMHGDVVQNLYLNREIRSSWPRLVALGGSTRRRCARALARSSIRSGSAGRFRSTARAGTLGRPAPGHRDRARRRLEPANGVP